MCDRRDDAVDDNGNGDGLRPACVEDATDVQRKRIAGEIDRSKLRAIVNRNLYVR